MPEEDAEEADRGDAMDDAGHPRAAERLADQRRPRRVGIEKRHAGEHQEDHADGEAHMRDAPDQRPAVVIDMLFVRRQLGDFDVRPVLLLLVIPVFAVIPQRRMRPEEANTPPSSSSMNFEASQTCRIALEIVGSWRAARTVMKPAVASAWHSGRSSAGWPGRRSKPDSVTRWMLWLPWQLKHLRGEGKAQLVDLTVIGVEIGGVFLLVAIAAVLGDDELGRRQERILDVHAVMAIRTNRRARIAVLQHLLAVHRILVILSS